MTRDLALDDARKTVKTSRRTPLGEQPIPMTEWLALCEKTADQVMAGTKTKQLGPLFRRAAVRRAVHSGRAEDPEVPRPAHKSEGHPYR
ncbi:MULTISPECIES: hypothetical protein [unclassified Pseudomonas]|uniref:hypothetical protein n=1 Tax=unclassified Pseudomonas TaxID=196821 RepID=UPI0015867D63|nr:MULTISPECIES: hypothetical protein [unclassified Pseudomonas]